MFFLWISEFSVNQNHALKSWVRLSRASLHQSAIPVVLQPAAARSLKAGSQFFKTFPCFSLPAIGLTRSKHQLFHFI